MIKLTKHPFTRQRIPLSTHVATPFFLCDCWARFFASFKFFYWVVHCFTKEATVWLEASIHVMSQLFFSFKNFHKKTHFQYMRFLCTLLRCISSPNFDTKRFRHFLHENIFLSFQSKRVAHDREDCSLFQTASYICYKRKGEGFHGL